MNKYSEEIEAVRQLIAACEGNPIKSVKIPGIEVVFSDESVDNDVDLKTDQPPAEPGPHSPFPASAFPDGVTPRFGNIERDKE